MKSMLKKGFFGAAVVALAYLGDVAAEPTGNGVAFCEGLEPGLYCDPFDALYMVSCPTGKRTQCPGYRFCATVGRVPDCYQCEAGFDLVEFCAARGAGTFCAPPNSGANSAFECPSGKEIRCPFGSHCQAVSMNAAICAIGSPCPESSKTDDSMTSIHVTNYTTLTDVSHSITDPYTSSTAVQDRSSSTHVLCPFRTTFTSITIYNKTSLNVVCQSTNATSTSISSKLTTKTSTSAFVPVTKTVPTVVRVLETIKSTDIDFKTTTISLGDVSRVNVTSIATVTVTSPFPLFCTDPVTLTHVTNGQSSFYSVCLGATMSHSCAKGVTNNMGQSFCLSPVLPPASKTP